MGGNAPVDHVFSIVEDRSGRIWFGTAGGARYIYEKSDFNYCSFDGGYTTASGLASNDVLAVLEDQSGDMWFGTVNGLSRFDGTKWRRYTTADGLASNHITAIFQDSSGNLWAGTLRGVSRLRRRQVADLHRGGRARGRPHFRDPGGRLRGHLGCDQVLRREPL